MKTISLFLILYFSLFTNAFGVDLRTLTTQAVEYTLEAKIKSQAFNVSRMLSVPSMVLIKDGKKHRFSFKDAPDIWINYVYDANLGAGQFEWKSKTRESPAYNGAIIHRKYCQVYELLLPIERILDSTRLNKGAYALTSGSYQQKPCYLISIRYPDDEKTIATASLYDFDPNFVYQLKKDAPESIGGDYRITPELFDQHKAEFYEEYFAGIQISIDKTPGKPFIYAIKAFNRNGKVIYDMNWGTVTFLDHIDPAEFQLPGKKIVEVNSHKEYSKQNRILFRPMYNDPTYFSKTRDWLGACCRSSWSFALQYGAYITATIGLLAVVAILLIRFMKR